MKAMKGSLLSLAVLASLSSGAMAETIWSDTSLTLLYGSDYKVGEDDRVTMTLEHVSGHNWGDIFFFVDRLQDQGGDTPDKETYGELSPRLSLSYLSGNKLAAGPIKDVYLAGTYEFDARKNGGGFDNYLYGFGLDWSVPGTQYFHSEVYYAANESIDSDYQLTLVWGSPFAFGNHKFLFDGYIDWSSAEDDHAAEFHFNPQMKWDVGNYFGTPGKLYVGFEYSYWHNKFGLTDDQFPGLGSTRENLFSALIKAHW